MASINIPMQDLQTIRQILPVIGDYRVCAFGSRTKDTAKPFSDLDLVVISNEPLSLDKMAQIKEAFAESNLVYKVDVSDWASLSEDFRERILPDLVKIEF